MKTVAIKDIRPTQLTHGLREIVQKTQFYESLSGRDLKMAIAEKPVPLVLGPGGVPFAIDHHHVATALRRAGIKAVPVVLVADLSQLSYQDFWLSMDNNRWTYPYNATGQRKSFADMPEHVWELEDDVFRSLAASVRDAGGYEKTTVPLEEFRWADFFRTCLPNPETEDDFLSIQRRAVKLAKSKAAAGLPGFVGSVPG
ncbi:ParB/Srx family N-terminal domain-containing protein [Paraburkholderia sp. HD33-4]|uniref:ParB/Srx family N-terminal domain-containing protein n=1 Tax=Paraburkholderia sp. HD33-4 TaxID=2883242 RepID=UPI001F3D609A|nr:ParB/Srx family N-terminal domain-containing protein [Paraburkholderia sp. HD33-4]